jgi:glucan phosphoethanolaminetransferase (alkaline phosphatase superfamily)
MAPYIAGIALGYIMYKHKNAKLSLLCVVSGWCVSFATMYLVIFGAFDLVQFEHQYNATESALYASLHRVSWAIAVGWLIFACNNGYGGNDATKLTSPITKRCCFLYFVGWITRYLSLGIFQPLSKISYCIYLTHYAILMIGTARIKSPLFVDEYSMVS